MLILPSRARFAWEIIVDPEASSRDEPPEMKLGRISRGVDLEFMQRKPLRV